MKWRDSKRHEEETCHLCWIKLVLNSGFNKGGWGCWNSEVNSRRDAGNGGHGEVAEVKDARSI